MTTFNSDGDDDPVSSCTSTGTFTPTTNNSTCLENYNKNKFHLYSDNFDDPLQQSNTSINTPPVHIIGIFIDKCYASSSNDEIDNKYDCDDTDCYCNLDYCAECDCYPSDNDCKCNCDDHEYNKEYESSSEEED